ncbi:hydrolase [Amycolatopsis sp. WAC 04197]|uniref:alpha/beta hydrolase n=1 Tax=Amycolatopsis sp. WAC 04197 TaxID=2203199 RepID=UPI000F76CE3A|nr:alpha/beta hydrolase [Amycolatopsis sp. WAC 04197]RSN46134.1 hydrolase [Amycolatopsis sp. WAC 04197]
MRRALTIVVAATTAAVMFAPPGLAQTGLEWGECPADVAKHGLRCTTIDVPLDYRDPDGQRIQLAVSRLASKNPDKRRGVLLTNPGGPGGSGLDFPSGLVDLKLPQSVLDSYDIIGFDPRGVGRSTPVTCDLTTEQQYRGNIPPYARNAADVLTQARNAKTVAGQCAESKTANLLPHVSTAATARDMDRIREALHEDKLSFLGYSYGTHLGAVYTTLFPDRGDRIVLDSNLGPGGLDRTGSRLFGPGMEKRFPDFAEFAAARPEYDLGTSPEAVTAKYFDLAARLDKTPVQGYDGNLFRLATFGSLYRDSRMPALAELWKALDTNQPPPPAAAAEAQPNLENAVASHLYVICNDSRWPKSVGSYLHDVAVDRKHYPMFGASGANIRPCAFWRSEPAEPPVRVGDQGPSNVLLAQNTRDPATPQAGAEQMRRALGDRARMVTADQGGHGAYLIGANKCANDTVTAFLTTGERPQDDRVCAAEPARHPPAGASHSSEPVTYDVVSLVPPPLP